MTQSLLLNPEKAAEMLSVSRSSIYKLIADGTLQSVKIGKSRRIRVADLKTFIGSLHEGVRGEVHDNE